MSSPQASRTAFPEITGQTDGQGHPHPLRRTHGRLGGQPGDDATALARARAKLVCARLRRKGVVVEISVVSHGNASPIATNTTEAGRAINRRVGVSIVHPIAVRPLSASTRGRAGGWQSGGNMRVAGP